LRLRQRLNIQASPKNRLRSQVTIFLFPKGIGVDAFEHSFRCLDCGHNHHSQGVIVGDEHNSLPWLEIKPFTNWTRDDHLKFR
jgi:hypothetical protein